LCCEIPVYGGRLFEQGDEILLGGETNKVPIIVVFTKYDQLVERMRNDLVSSIMDDIQWEYQAKEAATKFVRDKCEKPLNDVAGDRHAWTHVSTSSEYKDTIEKLVVLTMNSIVGVPKVDNSRTTIDEGAADSQGPNLGSWLLAAAQRSSLKTKITMSIDVGRHKYWGYMFSGAFAGRPLRECIGVIHDDIINVWNFHDPDRQGLKSPEFRTQILNMLADLGDPPDPSSDVDIDTQNEPSSDLTFILQAPMFVAAEVASWVRGMYRKTSETLRFLMGYVIDIIIVMSCLFALVDSRGLDQISPAVVNLVVGAYSDSPHKRRVHNLIRSYIDGTSLQALRPGRAIEQISDLVQVDKDLHEAVISAYTQNSESPQE